ncbi:MAG: hypothetical protein M1565_01165 [Actinobacteria bacterium]|nr:hypothetical protein [Actinomycetota bacterium]
MSLADCPIATECVVTSISPTAEGESFRFVGVNEGVTARVMARFPESSPRFAEVELEGARYVTLPLSTASGVTVERSSGSEVSR